MKCNNQCKQGRKCDCDEGFKIEVTLGVLLVVMVLYVLGTAFWSMTR